MDESDEQWIRSLLAAGAGGITVGPVSRDDLVAAGRVRLARRRGLIGAGLAAVAAFVLTGYALAAPGGGGSRPGHPLVSASATSAAARPTSIEARTRPADSTPTPTVS